MFRRKIYDEMISWKNNLPTNRKALVIKGLRQVGKTFIVRFFAEQNYENVVYADLKANELLKGAFEGPLDVDRMVMNLSAAIPGVRFVPGKTVIVLDEIQECANARASIKPFIEDGRFDIICTGSLMGIKGYNRKAGKGVPVGFEHTLYMKPMDFEEFLWAKGIDGSVIDSLRTYLNTESPVPETIHQSMNRYFREYTCVGGLPRVVSVFLNTSDFNAVLSEQRDIVDEYRDDFAKHLDEDGAEQRDDALLARINRVFESIPSQLAKENKKFQYSKLSKNARGASYHPAIQWLCDYGLIAECKRLTSMSLPLNGNSEEEVFKLYFQDSGLLVSLLDEGTVASILSGDLGIYKGAIFEEIMADALLKTGRKLYYYSKNSGLEVDFVTVLKGKPCIIEIKSTTGNTKSARFVLNNPDEYGVKNCIKFGNYNIGHNGGILTLPLYYSFAIDDITNLL